MTANAPAFAEAAVRVVIVGTGNIARFHVEVLRSLGASRGGRVGARGEAADPEGAHGS